jgi:hypothetical protein
MPRSVPWQQKKGQKPFYRLSKNQGSYPLVPGFLFIDIYKVPKLV